MADREDTQDSSLGAESTLLARMGAAPPAGEDEAPASDPTPADDFLRAVAHIDEAPPLPAELLGERLGHFEVEAVLGRGGMGVAYRAADLDLGRKVALKLIRRDEPALTARLLREARAQARVDHEGVCKVFEAGEVDGRAYIAMELVDGRPLGEAAAGMSLPQKVQVVRDVARALHAAHVLGIVHRDVKPSNVLVETLEDGTLRPVVMDFGIARDEAAGHGTTETGDVMGTPAYMSPEQVRGDRRTLDRRSDVYSLGATFYELLAGEPPFGGNVVLMMHAVLDDEPTPLHARVPALPEDLGTIVAKCLRKEPDQRYDSARALAEDLDRYIRGEPILGRRESLASRLRRRARKHRALVLLAALALCALGTAVGLGVRARIAARRQAAELAAQAELGRELGQDVKDMEWFLRAAHLRPLHDLSRERAVVKEKMARLEARAAGGGMAAAMVDYAVGRGHLALDEDAEAVARLERAERGEIDTPELHFALGLARGRLYQKGLVDAQRLPDARSIERRRREIEEQYLKPALASMEKSRDVRLEAPSYLPGLLASYQKDYEGALRLAEKAQEEAPWLYEAIELQADALLARGISEENGQRDAAARDLEEAARLYDAAAESGRSDASLYLGSAEAWIQRMMVKSNQPASRDASPEDNVARALDRCEKAAVARPDTSVPHTKMATALDSMAFHLLRVGGDPRPILARALAAVDRAFAIRGDDFESHVAQVGALRIRADYEASRGLDASASIDQLVASARRLVDLAPMDARGHWKVHQGLFFRAQHVVETGGDPEPDLRASLESQRRAFALDEAEVSMFYKAQLGDHALLAYWKATRGRDPSEEATMAAGAFAGCVKAQPDYPSCYGNMAGVEAALADYQIAAGLPAHETLSHAQEHVQKARSLGPDEFAILGQLAYVHGLRAKDAVRRGEDPAPALQAAGEDLADCYRHDAKNADCTLEDARLALLLADVEARAHRPERPALDRALALALLAVERGPRFADAHQVLAEAEHRLAALAATPADQAKHRAAGLEACARGLAINPNHPRLLATRGALLLLDARAADSAAAKTESARKAREVLQRAAELNPLLRREAGPLLDEAERLGG